MEVDSGIEDEPDKNEAMSSELLSRAFERSSTMLTSLEEYIEGSREMIILNRTMTHSSCQ